MEPVLLAFGRQSTQPIIPSLLSQPVAFMVIPHSLLSLGKRRVCQLVARKEEEEAQTPPFKGTSHKQHGTLLCQHGRHSCTRGLELNYSTTQTHTCACIYTFHVCTCSRKAPKDRGFSCYGKATERENISSCKRCQFM